MISSAAARVLSGWLVGGAAKGLLDSGSKLTSRRRTQGSSHLLGFVFLIGIHYFFSFIISLKSCHSLFCKGSEVAKGQSSSEGVAPPKLLEPTFLSPAFLFSLRLSVAPLSRLTASHCCYQDKQTSNQWMFSFIRLSFLLHRSNGSL